MYRPLENQLWRGRTCGEYTIKNITSRINEKTGNREYYIMLDYRMAWFKLCVDKNLNSYIRVNGEKIFLKDFIYENKFKQEK